ncbi:MAG: ATP-binding cassette domain-containing protein [Spirochaetaceae bacterium]|nr:ATP-binding cassette domain-containing protein [Spirochaetaceae bacterium]
MEIFKADSVSYTYPDSPKKAVRDISFSIEKGSYTAILGANGSGKSTLARLICGFLAPDAGTMTFVCEKAEDGKTAPTGIVFQEPKPQIIASIVKKDTELGPKNLKNTVQEVSDAADKVLELTKLSEKKDDSVLSLSLGQTQKLALSGILAMSPEFLVLDEAVSMVDPETRDEILRFVSDCNKKGQTVISITHDISEALMADHILAMDDGNLIFDGTKEDFEKSPVKDNLFGEPPKNTRARTAACGETTLALSNISFSYRKNTVLDDISVSFERGTLTAITGASGSGKSTLFEIASGLLSAQSGKVTATTRPVLSLQDSSAALFEEFAADDVAYGPINNGVSGVQLKERVKTAMEMARLPYETFAEKKSVELSGGEKRKLSTAGIIALDSDVMLFDEPCAGLDPAGRKHILETFMRLCDAGKTIVFSTHRLEEADIADRHLVIKDGKLYEAGAETRVSGGAGTAPDKAGDANGSISAGTADSSLAECPPLDTGILLNRLRKTTGGLYEKGTAPVYKLPPALKYVLFLLCFIPGTVFSNLYISAAMVPVALIYASLTGLKLLKAAKNVFRLIPWLLIFSFLQLLLISPGADETILLKIGFIAISDGKIKLFVTTLFHLICGIFCLYGFLHSISETEAAEGFQKLVPSKTAALVLIVMFRFIPLLADEAALIIKVQLIRGGLKSKKGFFKNLKALLPLFVPLIIRTIQRAESMADALTARYF